MEDGYDVGYKEGQMDARPELTTLRERCEGLRETMRDQRTDMLQAMDERDTLRARVAELEGEKKVTIRQVERAPFSIQPEHEWEEPETEQVARLRDQVKELEGENEKLRLDARLELPLGAGKAALDSAERLASALEEVARLRAKLAECSWHGDSDER